MAEVTRYINTDSSGGDGTTNNTSGATAAYASAASWESNEQDDLVTATDNHVVNASCPSGTADGRFIIDGWTTSAAYDVQFKGDNNALVFNDTDKYHIAFTPNGSYQYGVWIRDEYITMSGGQVHTGAQGVYTDINGIFVDGSLAGIYIENFGVYNNSGTRYTDANSHGINLQWGSTPIYVSNCVMVRFYEGLHTPALYTTEADSYKIYSNTANDNETGFHFENTTARSRNNIGANNGTDFVEATGDWHDYNLSTDASADGANSVTSGSVTFTSTTAGSWDFHLANDTTDAAGAGADLDADTYYPVTIDADGDTRHATAPDIGADEFVSSGATALPFRMRY